MDLGNQPTNRRVNTMNDIIATALAAAKKNTARLTRVQVYHLTAAGLLGMNEEGEFIVTEKAERRVARGKNAQLVAEWKPQVLEAVKQLGTDVERHIRVDDVWKFLGCPDKKTHRTPILKNLQAMRDEGLLEQHKRGNSNFGIYYTVTPEFLA